MFTGIIEEIGTIKQVIRGDQAIILEIEAEKVLEDVKLGDSIAVNGVCLTVTTFTSKRFTVDVMPETIRATSLKTLNAGSKVNLERAMIANGRFGGHFVSGHVDGIGTIQDKKRMGNAVYYTITVEDTISRYFMLKGSVTVDGTSLTIFGVTDNSFTISLIPHTLNETILGGKGKGDLVNIEVDMLAKYMEHLLKQQNSTPSSKSIMSASFLEEHGFK
ncbi:riboflavin synthase [Sutcliffiella horikoshii]|uniref:Riboflavin synthase n=1 Tax=Sutcliffiella horikoshii TaxID=79883 RepID=A0AA94WNH6_9BACI|nr:riboflavin synthase [Sutcliffiella horikoshii]TYS55833.1 riboflavin synthase [Sutcliffiella horikoshii]